jgi:hypothetical protein
MIAEAEPSAAAILAPAGGAAAATDPATDLSHSPLT